MNILKEFTLDDKCSYLDNKEQTTHYKIINDCSTLQCQELIERGYRRFGKMYFRPTCATCIECQSIKIDVDNFKFSKSQRRVIKKAQHLESYIQRPSMSQEHLELFEKYHLYMKDKRSWEHTPVTPRSYYSSFVDAHNEFGYEILYYENDKLIAVDLVDILEDGVSSIYFYYDPDYTHLSLGKLSLYNQITFAQKSNKRWIYLGYYVEDCPSLSYKAQYKPYYTLEGQPELDQEYVWYNLDS
ncbi:arginyltransferase [Sulfurimonas sp.]|nr:arginyltransferase [Sulfurimonas sp.]